MADSGAVLDHKAWLGYLQPEGLVVSPAALVDSQVILGRNAADRHQSFLDHVTVVEVADEPCYALEDVEQFVRGFLRWDDDLVLGRLDGPPVPEDLAVGLADLGETLQPSLVVLDGFDDDAKPLLLVQSVPVETDLDAATTGAQAGWSASASQRLERLLRETGVPIGILTNRRQIRLVYAPRGESAGTLTFPVAFMAEVAGRPVVWALDKLLSSDRLHAGSLDSRLPALLARSREYQSQVSAALAGQVLEALYELLRGFEAADARSKAELLHDVLAKDPNTVYRGLLGVLMRLVFLLYAEDRGLMPDTALYARNYSVHGLFDRLRADAERHPDIMDQRYGAWAQFIALCRVVHSGCRHPDLAMPPRLGHLFDPERYLFLEGRTLREPQTPLVSDGCLERVLRRLLILNGERLSYRTLDVEEIGSVYQTIMGFELRIAEHESIAIVGKRKHRSEVPAPVVVDLDALLHQKGSDRAKWLRDRTGHDWDGKQAQAVRDAATSDEMLAALDKRIARHATPHPVAAGGLVLQPTDERRRTGSHYTPRKLTEPIVRKTLEPVLRQLGDQPRPEQILDLRVCDLAMGSGAFLVEACRQLGAALEQAWGVHGGMPELPAGEDEVLLARRLVAQRCLYGVDRNAMATDLAKLSLWLATLAKDQPFTFLDHALRPGDSLVGLTRRQIAGFTWGEPTPQRAFGAGEIERRIQQAAEARAEIRAGGDWVTPADKATWLALANEAVERVAFIGDLAVAAFFGGAKETERTALRARLFDGVTEMLQGDGPALLRLHAARADMRNGEHPITPFHWEIEFPEVFGGADPGFDAIVGNPPFAGKNTLIGSSRDGFLDWLKQVHPESHGNADLVAHFFRRAFALLRPQGCFGLIATNTIGQGDTRSTGLRWVCKHGGTVYSARRRYKWPGQAAVVVSVVHVARGDTAPPFDLDGRTVPIVTAYLFHAGGHDDPARLQANAGRSFIGSYVLGMGFTFDDTDTKGVANPIALMDDLIARDPRNAEVIFPYIGGEEVNDSPTHAHHRYVINFGDRAEAECRECWPDLMRIVEEKVKPERDIIKDAYGRDNWWRHMRTRPEMHAAIAGLERVLVIAQTSNALAFAFQPTDRVFGHTLIVLPYSRHACFAAMQSQVHRHWAATFAASMKDDLRYIPSDCFETYPFPPGWESNEAPETAGREYYEHRAELMIRGDEGLTKTYNRFHDPEETDPDILRLRELHAEMDRAVLDAYGWQDIPTDCDFFLEYDDEDEDADGKPGKRKKPWRYRWPDDVRDEVLARLLDLNARRAEEERLAGPAAGRKRSARQTAESDDIAEGLFG